MQENMIEKNIIIREPSRNLRALGRNALRDNWKISIIAVIAYLIVLNVSPIIFNAIFGTNIGSMFTSNGYTYGFDAETYAQIYNGMPRHCFLSSVYVILVTGALTLGISMFFLAVFRKHEVHVADIFLGFEHFVKALGLFVYQSIFIVLWTLLFIVPGIIATFRYSQAFYILADDPTKGIRQCMNESKTMMKGNKGKYFCLSLSFIGWVLFCSIPSTIVQLIGSTVSNSAFVIALFGVAGTLFMAPVMVYMYSTFAGFYEILAGHLIKDTDPIPVTAKEAQEMYAKLTSSEKTEESEDESGAEEEAKDEIEETADKEEESKDE